MIVYKCKMCGGSLEIQDGVTVCKCEYCGVTQTVPNLDNEKKINLFTRANRLRSACEFDKASGVYESILSDFTEEPEAYWGLLLCKYGIEYIDDPKSGKKIPTCHRSSFDSIFDDQDFEMVMEYSDSESRSVYREEAKTIEQLRIKINEVSSKEDPYDIFICYKETDAMGQRTIDSVIAQDVYEALIEKGYRVFFSRISLEDKLGQEYEPYIFAALNSAKVMLAFGTDYEYYNAVWVKNEWNRFLSLIEKGEKKTLIPCYKGIDAYDMPKEFARLQAQDMGKVGAIQDIVRGIEKIIPLNTMVSTSHLAFEVNSNTSPLLERINIFLSDGEWGKADEYCEKVLDLDPKNAMAYLGKVCAINEAGSYRELPLKNRRFYEDKNYQKFVKYITEEYREIDGFLFDAKEKITQEEEQALKEKENEEARKREEIKKIIDDRKKIYNPLYSFYMALAGVRADGKVEWTNMDLYKDEQISSWTDIKSISMHIGHVVGLHYDGTVIATGSNTYGQCNVSDWNGIISVKAGNLHTVGLNMDGTVVATGDNSYGQCEVSGWRDIKEIYVYEDATIGLRSDGTVVAFGNNVDGMLDVSKWKDIKSVSVGYGRTLGLCMDGTVVAAGSNFCGSCNVSDWKDIIMVAAGYDFTLGLKSDGTVVSTEWNGCSRCDVLGWKDIIMISAGEYGIGLCANGNVVSSCFSGETSKWENMLFVLAESDWLFGLCSDGNVKLYGKFDRDYDGYAFMEEVSKWKLFDNPSDYLSSEEWNELHKKTSIIYEKCEESKVSAAEEKRKQLEEEKQNLLFELGKLNGLFTGKRRKEISARILEIENELINI